MFRLPKSIDHLSPVELYQKYGQPNVEPFVRLDGKHLSDGVPPHGIVPIWLGNKSELVTLSEAKIFITGFRESFLPSTTRRHCGCTGQAAKRVVAGMGCARKMVHGGGSEKIRRSR
ncbi:uncharacterized protein BJX67DRAFT_167857 [Aspergillus lucknowensis]|uniref:GST N-terminal domain-containing protein n=1 Tax=Aspergillus lucknowensis TaxID=176173 RepID=A0ABR4M555_9EURO